MSEDIKPLIEVLPDQMCSKTHTILVQGFLFGQYRIQLTRLDRPDPFAPPGHGSIVRELCTYNPHTAGTVALILRLASDPEAYCRELERSWNCEDPGHGRIRLDNPEPFKCPRCGFESYSPRDKQEKYCVRCHIFTADPA
jgi:hypothetical protein